METSIRARYVSVIVFSLVVGLGSATRQVKPSLNCPPKNERGRFCSENSGCNALMRAAESGDLNQVRTELDQGADVNARIAGGQTALMLASASGQLRVVTVLLKARADPNATAFSFHGGEFSTLMAGLDRCNKDWMRILDAMIAAGGEVNPKGPFSRSPLMYAVERKDVVLVKALLARGADVNLKNEIGITPLMSATVSSIPSIEVVKLLLAAGADVDARSKDGETALSLLDMYPKDKTTRDQISRLLKPAP